MSQLTRGATVWIGGRRPAGRHNVNYLYDVNVEGFFNLLKERFARPSLQKDETPRAKSSTALVAGEVELEQLSA